MTPNDIIAAARTRADTDCRRAIEAAADARLGPEYIRSDDATGKRLIIPARAIAIGMLAHLRAAFEHNHRRKAA